MKFNLIFSTAFLLFSSLALADECLIKHIHGVFRDYYYIFKVERNCRHIGFDGRICDDKEVMVRSGIGENELDAAKRNLQFSGQCTSFRYVI